MNYFGVLLSIVNSIRCACIYPLNRLISFSLKSQCCLMLTSGNLSISNVYLGFLVISISQVALVVLLRPKTANRFHQNCYQMGYLPVETLRFHTVWDETKFHMRLHLPIEDLEMETS